VSPKEGYSLESIIEMMSTFGAHHNRAGEMDWALNRALQRIQKEPKG